VKSVVLAGYYPPPMGGESVHVRELARWLRARGVPVQVLNLRPGAPPCVEYRAIGGPVGFLTALWNSLGPRALLHLHTNGHHRISCAIVVAAGMVLRIRRATGLLTLHSGLAPDYLARLDPVRRRLVRLGIASFTHVICVNPKIQEAVAQLGIEDHRLSVIPAYLGLPAIATLTEAERRMVAAFTPLLATMGGRDPEYGLPIVVDVVARLRARFPRLGCIVIGSGGDAALRRLITERGVADRVVCVGDLDHERCLAFLERADVYVRPTYADGDATSVREALALGVPVVASRTDFRPPGTTLFTPGDPEALHSVLVETLARGRGHDPADLAASPTSSEALLALYRRLAPSTGAEIVQEAWTR
jgi:glycogen synthase